MDEKRVKEIMKYQDIVHISYNGMPVRVESVNGGLAKVTLIGMDMEVTVSTSSLAEAEPTLIM